MSHKKCKKKNILDFTCIQISVSETENSTMLKWK